MRQRGGYAGRRSGSRITSAPAESSAASARSAGAPSAHIREYAREGPHEVRNGILLRADLHRLFDKGDVTVTPELRLEVSERLRKDFHNGRVVRTGRPATGSPCRNSA
jgi:hypothetical protein